jgi:hypothetical protein
MCGASGEVEVVTMQAVANHGRRSALALAVMLLGALVAVPSSVAQGAASAGSGAPIQRFLAISTNPKQNANAVLLGFGPIHAKGIDKTVNNHKDVFRFPNGSLIVRHQPVARHRQQDPTTCLFRFRERGKYQVVRGTGDYVGAHGHGRYVVHVTFVACRHQPPDAFVLRIRAHGPLQL